MKYLHETEFQIVISHLHTWSHRSSMESNLYNHLNHPQEVIGKYLQEGVVFHIAFGIHVFEEIHSHHHISYS